MFHDHLSSFVNVIFIVFIFCYIVVLFLFLLVVLFSFFIMMNFNRVCYFSVFEHIVLVCLGWLVVFAVTAGSWFQRKQLKVLTVITLKMSEEAARPEVKPTCFPK